MVLQGGYGGPLRVLSINVDQKQVKDKHEQVVKKLRELGDEIRQFKAEFSDYVEKVRRALLQSDEGKKINERGISSSSKKHEKRTTIICRREKETKVLARPKLGCNVPPLQK